MDNGYNQAGAWAVIYCAATNKFLLGKRSAKVNKSGAWNLFGGRIDSGEHPREALVRELGEEAGLSVKPRHLTKLHTVTRRLRSRRDGRDMHYFVMKAEREFSPRLNSEHSDYRWFKAKQLPSRFNNPTSIAIKKGLLDKAAGH
jgi:8-oxo-dGTP diphosphatase